LFILFTHLYSPFVPVKLKKYPQKITGLKFEIFPHAALKKTLYQQNFRPFFMVITLWFLGPNNLACHAAYLS
jgi:hypothetical protein